MTAGADMALDGTVTASTAMLDAGGSITQQASGSLVTAGAVTMTAGGDMALDGTVTASTATLDAGAAITQQAGGSLVTTGAVTMTAGADVALDGSVAASTATILAGGSASQQPSGSLVAQGLLEITTGLDITLDGIVRGNPIRLNAGRSIAQAQTGNLATTTLTIAAGGDARFGGALSADLLTGSAGGALEADGPATRIGLLQDVTAGSRLLVIDDDALQVEGIVAAPSAIVFAQGPLRLGTVSLSTGGVPFRQPPPGPVTLARLPEPVPGTPGAVFQTGSSILTVDRLTVTPLGTPNATLALRLPPGGGGITVNGLLEAPATDVTFDLGNGGRASGLINVRNLMVLGTNGTTELEGTVRGFDGSVAASVAVIGPRVEPKYQINGCPIGSVNCILLIVQIPVVTDPLKELGVSTSRDNPDDPDIYVPNVAERDF
jgi:hypothetical protein